MFKQARLTPIELAILRDKGTEAPFSHKDFDSQGSALCRQCGIALFRSQHQFHSGCGWPSFDQAIEGRVLALADSDGKRTEIVCQRCRAHLGHVFEGEGYTRHNIRHCVNGGSLEWVSSLDVQNSEEAIFAGGCFWGVEALFKRLPGVLLTEVGYSGGVIQAPSYEQVCHGTTQHLEVLRVVFDPQKISYALITQYFFEIHDPTQASGQGPDIGSQYHSAIFYYDDEQKRIAQDLILQLKQKSFDVASQLLPVQTFWPAESYHQDYYKKTGSEPYCHVYTKRF